MQCVQGKSLAILYTSSPSDYVEEASPDEASLWQMLCMHRERILTQMGYGLSNIDTSELEGIMKGDVLSRISREFCGRSANTINSNLLS